MELRHAPPRHGWAPSLATAARNVFEVVKSNGLPGSHPSCRQRSQLRFGRRLHGTSAGWFKFGPAPTPQCDRRARHGKSEGRDGGVLPAVRQEQFDDIAAEAILAQQGRGRTASSMRAEVGQPIRAQQFALAGHRQPQELDGEGRRRADRDLRMRAAPEGAPDAPVAPNAGPPLCAVKKQPETLEDKTPVESTIWGFAWDHPGRQKTSRDRVTCGRSSHGNRT